MYLDTNLGLLTLPTFKPVAAAAPVPRAFPNVSQLLARRPAVAVLPAPRLMPALPRYGGAIHLTPANVPVVSSSPTNALAPVSTGMDVPPATTQTLGPDAPPAAEPADSSAAPPAATSVSGINPLVWVAAAAVAVWAFKGRGGGRSEIRGW